MGNIENMPDKPNLLPLAMIVCDSVIEDKMTNKKSLIGLFDNINSSKIPCVHPGLNVFVVLTEGNGEYECSLKCIHEDTNKSLVGLNARIHCKNPREKIELNFELRGLRLPEYGNYRFEFYCNDNPIISRKFLLQEAKI